MGKRGPGARPKAKAGGIMGGPKLRNQLPWEVDGLTRVERVIAFLEDLPVTQGKLAGTKLVLRDWQKEFVSSVYATDENSRRAIRTAILSMARKNGKTALTAGLALCHLVGPEAEPRGEVYACAMDKQQAGKAYAECKAMLLDHAELSQRINIKDFLKEIEVLDGDGRGSIFKALSADADSKLGLSPSFVICDEAGYWPKRDLYDAMNSALGARDEPLIMLISTQAKDDVHFFSELVDYGLKVKAGEEVDDTIHVTLFSAPEELPIDALETWQLANPALGDFRDLSDVERQAMAAVRLPSAEADFRNKILNQRISAHTRFLTKAEWEACNVSEIVLGDYDGRDCYAGLDLSSKRDLTAWVLVFPNDDGTFDVLPRFFLPEHGIDEKSDADRTPWNIWAKDDEARLTLIPGKTVNYEDVATYIGRDVERYNIISCGFDRWRMDDLKRELDKQAIELEMLEIGQGFKDMGPVVDATETAVIDGKLNHGGNVVLKTCAANVVISKDPTGARKFDKAKASGRIDGIVALGMALRTAESFAEEDDGPGCLNW